MYREVHPDNTEDRRARRRASLSFVIIYLNICSLVCPSLQMDLSARSCVSFGRSGSWALRNVGTSGGGAGGEDEEFHDAVEDTEKSLRVELQTSLGGKAPAAAAAAAAAAGTGTAADVPSATRPAATLSITSLPVELHWRQQSLRRILQTLAAYRHTVHAQLQLHIDELSEASAAALGPRGILSKEAVAAVHDTLQTVQQTLSLVHEGEGEDVNETTRSASGRMRIPSAALSTSASLLRRATSAVTGRDWLRTGLDLGGELPPLPVHQHSTTGGTVREAPPPATATTTTAAAAAAAGSAAGPTPPQETANAGVELTLTFREVAVAFWETNDTILARMALKDLTAFSSFYSNGDTETSFAVGDGGIVFRDRCVLGPRSAYRPPTYQQQQRRWSAGTQETTAKGEHGPNLHPHTPAAAAAAAAAAGGAKAAGEAASPTALFSARIRQYGGHDPVLGGPLPYSMCLEGQLQQICFVYRQQDVSRTLDYLRDGIFDVFISKSYRAVKEAATASYCLFALDIQSPLFILAEDKAIIPGYVPPPGYRLPRRGTNTSSSSSSSDVTPSIDAAGPVAAAATAGAAAAAAAPQMEVQVDHLGRFIVFDLGNLKVCNAYVHSIVQQQQQQQQEGCPVLGHLRPPTFGEGVPAAAAGDRRDIHEGETSDGGEDVVFSDLKLEMKGMRISASDNGQEAAVGGCLLESVDASMVLRSSVSSLCIEAETTAWLLHLSRQQLTLIIDAVNENIGGHGYSAPVEVVKGRAAAAAAAEGGGAAAVPCMGIADLMQELETPPLAVDVIMNIPQLTLEASYGPAAPLALLSVHCITARVAASVSRLFSSYRFLLCGDAFSIDDLRSGVANYYKRVADCTAPEGDLSSDTHSTGWDLEETHEETPDEEDEEDGSPADVSCGGRNVTSGGRSPCSLQSPAAGGRGRRQRPPGLQFEFASSLRESSMDFQFSSVTVYLLLVAFMDILSYFTSAWAFSSMRSYPKPLPTLLKEREQQQQPQQEEEGQEEDPITAVPAGSPPPEPAEGPGASISLSEKGEETPHLDTARGDLASLLLSGEALRNRPFRVSVSINRGRFLVYSDLQSPSAPVIVWTSDFLVGLNMKGDELLFDNVQVLGSKIFRLDAAPLRAVPIRSQTHIGVFTNRRRTGGRLSTHSRAPQDDTSTGDSPSARRIGWQNVGSSSSSSSSSSMELAAAVCGTRKTWDEDSKRANRQQQQQQQQHQQQLLLREWLQEQQLQQLGVVDGPPIEHLAPRTDPASAVLLCEQFHLEGSGVYRSIMGTSPEGGDPQQPQQQQQQQQQTATAGAAAAATQSGHGRVPVALQQMQRDLSSAAANVPHSSISLHPLASRRGTAVPSSSPSVAGEQQQQQQQQQSLMHQAQPEQQQRAVVLRGPEAGVEHVEDEVPAAHVRAMTFIDMSFDIPRMLLPVVVAVVVAAIVALHADVYLFIL